MKYTIHPSDADASLQKLEETSGWKKAEEGSIESTLGPRASEFPRLGFESCTNPIVCSFASMSRRIF